LFCCGDSHGSALCVSLTGDPSLDACYRSSHHACVAGVLEVVTQVCDGDVICDVPCCGGVTATAGPGGVCCGQIDTGEGTVDTWCSSGACVPRDEACTTDDDCSGTQRCATRDNSPGNGSCCPPHRFYENDQATASLGFPYYDCCAENEENLPSYSGGHPWCRRVPDFEETSNKTWTR
jgi:hypothetical protein